MKANDQRCHVRAAERAIVSELVRSLDEVRDAAQAELEEEEHRPPMRAPSVLRWQIAVVRALLVPRPVGDEF